MEWISVKEKGLPEPDIEKKYIIIRNDGELGYGHFHEEYDWSPITHKLEKTGKNRWYLDFDAACHEDEISYYMEVIYPEGYWEEDNITEYKGI
jgi:hypothetical protein